jgi:bisphosphoglycerate-independent phosphoglycerate mutase (AlkP superfamily)
VRRPAHGGRCGRGGILVLTADHGNADEMYERNKKGEVAMDKRTGQPKPKTSHSLNPVPCFIWDPAGASNVRDPRRRCRAGWASPA